MAAKKRRASNPKYATILQRIGAFLIDMIIITILSGILIAIGFIGSAAAGTLFFGFALAGFTILFLYFVVLETIWEGQTVGKKVLNIRVVKENGKKIKLVDSLLRNILRIIDNQIAGVVAVLLIVFTAKRQRLGDLVAGTIVVKD